MQEDRLASLNEGTLRTEAQTLQAEELAVHQQHKDARGNTQRPLLRWLRFWSRNRSG